jgi:hypothetical protein
MKYLGITLASLGLVSAASVTKKVDYADWKVYRVNVGANADKVSKMMSKLQLEPWKGKPASSDVVDVMVSPSQLTEFEAETQDIETNVMHENLGASIEEENQFSVYAGMSQRILPSRTLLIMYLQLASRPTPPGSTRTTQSPTTCNGCQTWRQLTPAMRKLSPLESRSKDATSRESTSGAAAARAPRRPLSGTEPSTHASGSRPWYVSYLLHILHS